MKNLIWISSLFFVAGCSSSTDPYSAKIQSLAEESHQESQKTALYDQKLKALFDEHFLQNAFDTDQAAETGLEMLGNYPTDPPSSQEVSSMVRSGIPAKADQRIVFRSLFKIHELKIWPYQHLCFGLMESSKKFHWSKEKNKNLVSKIIKRDEWGIKNPSNLLSIGVDLSLTQKLIKDGLVLDSKGALDRLLALQKEMKSRSKIFNDGVNHWYYFPNVAWNQSGFFFDHAPQFFFKKFNSLMGDEFKWAAELEEKFEPIVNDLKVANGG